MNLATQAGMFSRGLVGGVTPYQAYLAAQNADSPVARWKAPTSGNTWAEDLNSWNGSGVNTPTLGTTPPLTGMTVASFNAASIEYVTVADRAGLDITGALTIEAWFKSSGLYANTRGILSKYLGAGNQRSYTLATDSSGNLLFSISPDGTFPSAKRITGASPIGTAWRHVAAVFTPSTRMEIFLDGVSYITSTSGIPASIYSSTADLWLGCRLSLITANAWSGDLGDMAVYDSALSSTRIAAHYAATGL